MAQMDTPDYCIAIDYERESEGPSRVFRTMSELIDAFEDLDRVLVRSIDVQVRPVLLLEDIETGSLKAWLREQVRGIPDEELAAFDWRHIIGRYLVKTKHIMINWCEDKTTISSMNQVEELQAKLHRTAEETNLRRIPAYAPVPARDLLTQTQKISDALSHLSKTDHAKFVSSEGEATFNAEFSVTPGSLDEILTKETICTATEMIIRVKKPDYLGDSQWEFKHGSQSIPAKMLDEAWLSPFRARKIDLRPGDALRAHVLADIHYGHDGDIVAAHYFVMRVHEIIKSPIQSQMSFGPGLNE